MSERGTTSAPASRRLDQWLWFARFTKSRSLAARLCAAGAVSVNGVAIKKPRHAIRVGDAVAVSQGPTRRTLRVVGLGERRGPAAAARLLYEETAPPVRLAETRPAWVALLAAGPAEADGID